MPFFIKKKKKVNRHAQFHEDLKTDFSFCCSTTVFFVDLYLVKYHLSGNKLFMDICHDVIVEWAGLSLKVSMRVDERKKNIHLAHTMS